MGFLTRRFSMEGDLWKMIVAEVRKIKAVYRGRWTFTVGEVVLTYFWGVLQNKPVSWACNRRHWPIGAWRRPLPTPSTMSRRLRTPGGREMGAGVGRAGLP